MEIENTRKVADEILKRIVAALNKIKNDEKNNVAVGSFQNGQEQGHSVKASRYTDEGCDFIWLGFSATRKSDEIVVYFGKIDPMQGVTHEMYQNLYTFSKDDYDAAANFVLMMLGRVLKKDIPRVSRRKHTTSSRYNLVKEQIIASGIKI